MKSRQAVNDYFWLTILWVLISFILRLTEWAMVSTTHVVNNLAYGELQGLLYDLLTVLTVSFIFLIPYLLLSNLLRKTTNILTLLLSTLFLTVHFCFIVYFKYELKPVDIFVLGYSFNELLFTIQTSGVKLWWAILCPLAIGIIMTISFLKLRKTTISSKTTYLFVFMLISGAIAHFVLNHNSYKWSDNETQYYVKVNKSSFFYENYFKHILSNNKTTDELSAIYISKLFPNKHIVNQDYPLLSATDFNDAIGNYFNVTDEKPNIVIIISEGLATKFIGDYKGVTFMPFLTNLSKQSLYWNNCLSTGERSHVAAPSILASTPYGEKGFALEEGGTYHFSFVNLLKDYYSSFYYGQGAWFDNKDNFLRNDGIDRIIDKDCYPVSYDKVMVDGYFWGYRDKELFTHSLHCIDTLKKQPRLDIYFTGTMHPPFSIDNEQYYNKKIDSIIRLLPETNKHFVAKYKEYLMSLLYTDDAYRQFFNDYSKRDDFKNTIFIITGDHPLTQIPFENSLDRFHVPIFIYSPMLKQGKTFHAVNSHFDILPTFVAFLKNKYNLDMPQHNGFMGKVIDTAHQFRCKTPVVQMNPNGQCIDMMYKNLFITNDMDLYTVKDNFSVERLNNDNLKRELSSLLSSFSSMRIDVCKNNTIIPDSLFLKATKAHILTNCQADSIVIEPNKEYFTLHESRNKIPNGRYFFELKGNIASPIQNNSPLIVIDIRDNDDRSIYWNSFNPTQKLPLRISFDIATKQPPVLKIFFWNKDKSNLKISNASWRLYTQSK